MSPWYFAESKPFCAFWHSEDFLFILTGTDKLLRGDPGPVALISQSV